MKSVVHTRTMHSGLGTAVLSIYPTYGKSKASPSVPCHRSPDMRVEQLAGKLMYSHLLGVHCNTSKLWDWPSRKKING